MLDQQRLVVAVFMAGVLVSCKKEAEGTPPEVTILSPASGHDLAIPDTLHVVADVSGAGAVDNVSFTITDANGIPIMAPLIVVPSSDPARLEVDIPIVSDLLAGGDHTLTVQANTADASGRDQRGIDIFPAPLRLRRVLVIGQPAPGTVSVHVIDSTGSVSQVNTMAMDLAGGAVSSAGRTFAIMGAVDGPLTAFAPDGMHVPWQKPNLSGSGIPWFTSLDLCTDGRYHVGMTDGTIRGYNAATGAAERLASLASLHRARTSLIVGDRLLVAQEHQSGASWKLGVYLSSSGTLVAEQPLDQETVALFRRDGSHALLFGNRDGQGVVEDRDIPNGGGWEPYLWNSDITAAEQVDANTYLIALADGRIERFTYANAGSIIIGSFAVTRDLAYEPVSGLVYLASGSDVLAIDPQEGTTTISWSIGHPVRYVLPLLNR